MRRINVVVLLCATRFPAGNHAKHDLTVTCHAHDWRTLENYHYVGECFEDNSCLQRRLCGQCYRGKSEPNVRPPSLHSLLCDATPYTHSLSSPYPPPLAPDPSTFLL